MYASLVVRHFTVISMSEPIHRFVYNLHTPGTVDENTSLGVTGEGGSRGEFE
jgi:hypothetical protein